MVEITTKKDNRGGNVSSTRTKEPTKNDNTAEINLKYYITYYEIMNYNL
jgi:hypothetical protein